MSWKGFTKAVARLPQRIAKTTGYSSETKDDDFEVLEGALKNLDTFARQLASEARKFKDSLSLMLATQESLSKAILDVMEPLGDPSDASQTDHGYNEFVFHAADDFAREMTEMRQSLLDDLDSIERLVVAPTADFITILDQVKRVTVKRAHKLLDYDRHRETVQKMKEKPDRSVSDEKRLGQYEASLDEATREYNNYNNMLKNDIPILLNLRVDFIDPCLLVFYSYQCRFYDSLFRRLQGIASKNYNTSTSALSGYQVQADTIQELFSVLTIAKPRPADLKRTGSGDNLGTKTNSLSRIPANSNTSPVERSASQSPSPSPYSNNSSNNNATFSAKQGADGNVNFQVNASPAAIAAGASYAAKTVNNNKALAASVAQAAYNQSAASPPPPYNQSSPKYVVALYDFDAQAQGDLSFRRGERIEVVEQTADANDWWVGRHNGHTGQFPGNYVQQV